MANLEELYQLYGRQVFNLALGYVQNIEDAEEITQDVFVAVHRKLGSFKGDSQISTWIYRIAINKSLDFLKARKASKRYAVFSHFFGLGGEVVHQPPDFNHPGILVEQKEELAFIFTFINQLPEKQKTALILHKLDQKSQKEIAEIMQISPKAVESLVQRARNALEKKINSYRGN